MKTIELTSPHNPTYKQWRKLQQSRKERDRRRRIVIEGDHLLEEARESGCLFHAILCHEAYRVPRDWVQWMKVQRIPLYRLKGSLYRQLMDTETPQEMAAVIDMPRPDRFRIEQASACVLLLDRIQDPGNLGTILRTALAAGASFVGLGSGTVDPFNPKVIRSAAGALFHMPFANVDLHDWILRFRQTGGYVVGTALQAEEAHFDIAYPERVAFVLGNEGQGMSPALLDRVDRHVRIPLVGKAESLNVAAAGAILLYEVVRQRTRG